MDMISFQKIYSNVLSNKQPLYEELNELIEL